ncbi:MAG: hypothetical protein EKK29_08055 [Hyphomicrobiales bacterium]|nr:MAG: hypothetical protein EKK29_08055 [Hyphomicrobiales bacterium]
MAKLPALVTALSECDGRERKTIDHIARLIREAGHISTTKRGSGASEMTARDAANLFIGANGCDSPNEAPLAIDRFRSLILHRSYTRPGCDVEAFNRVAEANNFGVALEAMIDGMDGVMSAADGFLESGYAQLPETISRVKKSLRTGSWGSGLIPFHFDIELKRYQAKITCSVNVASETGARDQSGVAGVWRTDFCAQFEIDVNRLEQGFYGLKSADRNVSVTATGFTLFKLWSAIQQHETQG